MKPDPSSPLRWPLLLALLSIAVLLAGSWLTRGFLTSDSLLAFELAAPEQAAYEWPIRQDAPFKYRLLFPTVVEGTWQLPRSGPTDNATFLLVYRVWSIVFYCAAVLSLYALLRVTGFGRDAAGAGGILMLLLPAMALAFTYPVHTHEDTLAYALLNLGLIGWLVLSRNRLRGHKQFGNMHLGCLVDGLCAPDDADALIVIATRTLAAEGVDLIVSNQQHHAWVAALRGAGYLSGPSNFVLATSPALTALAPEPRLLHMNRGDGDGPINL